MAGGNGFGGTDLFVVCKEGKKGIAVRRTLPVYVDSRKSQERGTRDIINGGMAEALCRWER
jgi:hypothetical protein